MNQHQIAGFSLIELLCVMAVGLISISMIVTIFMQSNRLAIESLAFAHMQESARFGIHFLTQEIQTAGFFGTLTSLTKKILFTIMG